MAKPPAPSTDTVFRIFAYGNTRADLLVIVPEPNLMQQVAAAWAYAVRYTAKGLDLPDYDAAVKMLMERHPSWQYIQSNVVDVHVNLALAEQDVPENR